MPRLLMALITSLLLAGSGCTPSSSSPSGAAHPAKSILTELQAYYVPDRRVARLDVELLPDGDHSLLLRGETTLPVAKDSLIQRLQEAGYQLVDSIRLLPLTELGEQTWGLTRVSVANLRSAPGHSQEMATQALLGTPLRVLQKQKEWYQVQTPDGYIAWLNRGELVRLDAQQLARWRESERVVFRPTYGQAYTSAHSSARPYGDLVAGCILEKIGTQGAMTQVRYPDGQTAYVATEQLVKWEDWTKRAAADVTEAVLAAAPRLLGVPYLWGGTSPKGMDCSGFTKTLYWQQGLIIPRDASQQVHAGQPVTYGEELADLLPGDFLFFGRYREDGSTKVTHVGIYLGDGAFIHSGADQGAIRIQNLRADHPDFAAHRRESLLAARRLTVGSPGVYTLGEYPWY
jgi:cell wall-associated NlpC family hydrolase